MCCKAGDKMEGTDDRITRYCLRPSTGVNRFVIFWEHLMSFHCSLCKTKIRGIHGFLLLHSSWKTQNKNRIPEVNFSLGRLFDLIVLAF